MCFIIYYYYYYFTSIIFDGGGTTIQFCLGHPFGQQRPCQTPKKR